MTEHTDYSPNEERNRFLLGWLAVVIFYNLFTIVSFATGGNNPLRLHHPARKRRSTPRPPSGLSTSPAAAAIIFAVATGLGYKLGYYGLVIAYAIMTVASLQLASILASSCVRVGRC